MGILPGQMSSAYGLARRGLDAFRGNEPPTEEFEMPLWGSVMIASTLFVFILMDFMIEYTFQQTYSYSCHDPDAKLDRKGVVEPELLLVKEQPITSSFKSTIKHLRARAGKGSYLRGVAMYLVKNYVLGLQLSFLSIFLPKILALPIATILCAPFDLAWTHIVISDPSPLPWYKRMPEIASIKKVMPATIICALAREAVYFLPGYLAISFSLFESEPSKMSPQELTTMGMQTASVIILASILAFLVLIPASVTLVRVQASLLAENEESIVPFDRTFGGRVSEDGVLGLLDAWRTFDWNSRVRLVKTYIKAAAMEMTLVMFFSIVLVSQVLMETLFTLTFKDSTLLPTTYLQIATFYFLKGFLILDEIRLNFSFVSQGVGLKNEIDTIKKQSVDFVVKLSSIHSLYFSSLDSNHNNIS
ncbi:hypothetical protein DID88_007748 [Monilinia fructigena]|uniref:Uncharacterized protein n=1 Tax=Monilinia fructigena TaxID=38457 RepID=A0A395J368_9HELO|nr:hypothetical protein DID88_007748 [Monilinia fructigena]